MVLYPEAYACLNPLIHFRKITKGMSLMVDIGGGTTDISFFTIENGLPQVYEYISIDEGLNFLTATSKEKMAGRKDSNIKSSNDIIPDRQDKYERTIEYQVNKLINTILNLFKSQTRFKVERIKDALKKRPIIYCGGGSTFHQLQKAFAGFSEIHLISGNEWDTKSIIDVAEIIHKNLGAILSTAYGLSISRASDEITKKPIKDLFAHMKDYTEDYQKHSTSNSFGSALGGFDYGTDYDAYK